MSVCEVCLWSVPWQRTELEPYFPNHGRITFLAKFDETYSIKRFDVGLVNEGNIPKKQVRIYKMAKKSRYLLDDPRIVVHVTLYMYHPSLVAHMVSVLGHVRLILVSYKPTQT